MENTAIEFQTETNSPVEFAKEAGLRYVNDNVPGFTRIKEGKEYIYLNKSGEQITDEKIINRIEALNIPHIWKDVWICPIANGHMQATGIDEKNRKQYRYHTKWQNARSETKFSKMLSFGHALSQLRDKIERDLHKQNFTRDKVLATVVSVLDNTLIRIGNKVYEKYNKSYGLTTLRNKHVKMEGKDIKIVFTGKKNVCHEILLTDKKLIRIVKKCKELPGHQLFQYFDENGEKHPVGSDEVNAYLRENTGIDLSAKDFRTWGGSTYAIQKLLEEPSPEKEKDISKKITEAIKFVASKLGNTATVCRKYYIHPLVLESYADGSLEELAQQTGDLQDSENEWLNREEQLFLALLKTTQTNDR